eukprot:Hpha_TRINITY_DN11786_c0_g1::TRINITY_DN11786_c0_g1_i1::g.31714::m.31714
MIRPDGVHGGPFLERPVLLGELRLSELGRLRGGMETLALLQKPLMGLLESLVLRLQALVLGRKVSALVAEGRKLLRTYAGDRIRGVSHQHHLRRTRPAPAVGKDTSCIPSDGNIAGVGAQNRSLRPRTTVLVVVSPAKRVTLDPTPCRWHWTVAGGRGARRGALDGFEPLQSVHSSCFRRSLVLLACPHPPGGGWDRGWGCGDERVLLKTRGSGRSGSRAGTVTHERYVADPGDLNLGAWAPHLTVVVLPRRHQVRCRARDAPPGNNPCSVLHRRVLLITDAPVPERGGVKAMSIAPPHRVSVHLHPFNHRIQPGKTWLRRGVNPQDAGDGLLHACSPSLSSMLLRPYSKKYRN